MKRKTMIICAFAAALMIAPTPVYATDSTETDSAAYTIIGNILYMIPAGAETERVMQGDALGNFHTNDTMILTVGYEQADLRYQNSDTVHQYLESHLSNFIADNQYDTDYVETKSEEDYSNGHPYVLKYFTCTNSEGIDLTCLAYNIYTDEGVAVFFAGWATEEMQDSYYEDFETIINSIRTITTEESTDTTLDETASDGTVSGDSISDEDYNTGITYENISRNPDDYEYEKIKFYGRVVQLIEDVNTDTIGLRLAVDDDSDSILYCEYDKSIVDSRVLEDDMITICGYSTGLVSYESTLGGTITIPSAYVEKIVIG